MNHKRIYPIFEPYIKTSHDTSRNKKRKAYKTRKDKTTPLKFPVTEEQEASFRMFWLLYKDDWNDIWKQDNRTGNDLTITAFLTMVYRFGIRHPELIIHDLPYQDTKIHKTVKLNQIEKDKLCGINGLTVQWKLRSNRKSLHRVMISILHYLQNGGLLIYEEVQPIRFNS